MRRLALALAAACSLASCAVPSGQPVQTAGTSVIIQGSTALAIAADAYAGVANLLQSAVEEGAFSKDQLRMIDTLNDQALKLLQSSNTGLTAAQRAASLVLIVTQLRSIIGSK